MYNNITLLGMGTQGVEIVNELIEGGIEHHLCLAELLHHHCRGLSWSQLSKRPVRLNEPAHFPFCNIKNSGKQTFHILYSRLYILNFSAAQVPIYNCGK
jgi:hypothetical protein